MSRAQLIGAGVGRRNRSHRSRWRSRTRLGASLVASAVALGGAGTASAAAGMPTTVSNATPSRMVQSQGNLYWTWNETPHLSFVYREAKTGAPGQEIPLASITSTTPMSLGDIAYAQINGTWFGFVVANYTSQGYSAILRVPLSPPPDPTKAAQAIVYVQPMIGQRDIATDGTNLYWASSGGLMGFQMATGTPFGLATATNIQHLLLDQGHVIYATGGQIKIVSKTPPASGIPTSSTVESAPSGVSITALSGLIDGSTDELAYGESNGSVLNVSGSAQGWGLPETDAPPRPGVAITTVAVSGPVEPSAVWGECTNAGCDLNTGGGNVTQVIGSPIDLQTESGQVFWGGAALYSMTDPPVIF